MDDVHETVVGLLDRLGSGDRTALDQLFSILYDELKDLSRRQRQRWHGNYTLDTTALVHEAYVKLVGRSRIDVESRAHFRSLAARAMRHILCDYARDRKAQKRGGGAEALTLDEPNVVPGSAGAPGGEGEVNLHTLLTLDDALRRLEEVDARASRVVECRFFGGLTIDETATAVGISPRTVKRDWAVAQAWLHREMGSPE